MSILDRYILKEFTKSFVLMMASFISVFIIVDFFGRIRMFLSNGAAAYQVLSYFFYSLPQVISQIVPVSILLGSLITFSMLSKNLEIIAMKANGVSLFRTAVPVVIFAVIASIISFFFNELIVPYSNQQANYIKIVEVQKQKSVWSFKQNQIWYKSRGAIYNFSFYDYEKQTINGITINYFDHDFNLIKRLDAREAKWTDQGWFFSDIMLTSFRDGFPSIQKIGSQIIPLDEKPADFVTVQREAEEMGYLELRKYVQKLQSEGYDVSRYITDLEGKLAFSFVNLILVVIGVAFSLRTERSGGIARSLGAGTIIGFSYWIIFAFGLSLGRSGTLPPFLAAWTANIIFGLASIPLIKKVRT